MTPLSSHGSDRGSHLPWAAVREVWNPMAITRMGWNDVAQTLPCGPPLVLLCASFPPWAHAAFLGQVSFLFLGS
jgi:hypothetical protein